MSKRDRDRDRDAERREDELDAIAAREMAGDPAARRSMGSVFDVSSNGPAKDVWHQWEIQG